MLREEFRRWAKHGCRLYGNDPWFFLRELAQNSRDADSSEIKVRAGRDASGREILVFEDDGTGMSFEHARRFLFRLYASSKEGDERSAGKYGIGFWSVLRFSPSRILVESRTRLGRWAILVDEDFTLTRVECRLARRGTRITLERDPGFKTEDLFREAVGEALGRFCRYLRRNDRTFSKLPVLYNDRNVTRSMRLPGPVSLSFKDGPVEGAVGLSETPGVRLHARGLPVWKGVLLDELSHTAERGSENSEIAEGLAPVFLLNGNDLNVIMSRRAVIDDSALARVRRKARSALARLVRLHMEHTFPRTYARRVLDAAERLWRHGRVKPAYVILAVALAVLATIVATRIPGLGRKPETPVSTLPLRYSGPVIEGSSTSTIIDLTYEPAGKAWLKSLTADSYDPLRGFVVPETQEHVDVPAHSCTEECVDVRVRLDTGGPIPLPMPGGYLLDTSSPTYNGVRIGSATRTPSGDTYVNLPLEGGILEYSCGPPPAPRQITDAERRRLTAVPASASLPPRIEKIVAQGRRKDVETRLIASLVTTRTLLTYDDSARAAVMFQGKEETEDWLSFVLGVRKGDCDVLNGVNALLLRRMGLPARVAIGLIGKAGRGAPELHAWTEYYEGGWHAIDATPTRDVVAAIPSSRDADPSPERILGPVPAEIRVAVSPSRSVQTGQTATVPAESRKDHPWFAALEHLPTTGLLAALGLLALACLVSMVLLVKRRSWEHMEDAEDQRLAEQILASIISSASSHPRMWRHARELWLHRILPTIGGRRISVIEARRLAGRRRLFLGRPGRKLARRAARSGSVVLDRNNEAFGPFLGRLLGVIDLDAIEELRPTRPRGRDVLDELLRTVNRLLSPSTSIVTLRAPGLVSEDFHDVDLSTLSYPGTGRFPKRFIAVNPTCELVRTCCDLHSRNPGLAAFELVERLAKDSLLLSDRAERIRYRAARALLEEAS